MRQLVVLLCGIGVHDGTVIVYLQALWVDGRDQAEFAVQYLQQCLEVLRPLDIAGGFQQFVVRTHVSFDVAAPFGQQRLQHPTGRFLVQSLFRLAGLRAERLFQKGDPHASRATHVFQAFGRPWFAFDHFGKQRQLNTDDLAILLQFCKRLINESVLFFRNIAGIF